MGLAPAYATDVFSALTPPLGEIFASLGIFQNNLVELDSDCANRRAGSLRDHAMHRLPIRITGNAPFDLDPECAICRLGILGQLCRVGIGALAPPQHAWRVG